MRKVALVSVISFFVVGFVITGFSGPADAQEIYYGCYNTRSGALRIVSDPALCTNKELPISWLSAEASNNLATRGLKVVFVSSGTYNGNLGGLAGADAKCQTLADAAGLPGTFKAWLSDSTTSPSTRFNKWPFGYALVNGTVVANSWSDLTDDSLNNPILIDENGNTVDAAPYSSYVWTATYGAGQSAANGNPYYSCSDWTSSDNGYNTVYGDASHTNNEIQSSWTAEWTIMCSYSLHLYCFQQ